MPLKTALLFQWSSIGCSEPRKFPVTFCVKFSEIQLSRKVLRYKTSISLIKKFWKPLMFEIWTIVNLHAVFQWPLSTVLSNIGPSTEYFLFIFQCFRPWRLKVCFKHCTRLQLRNIWVKKYEVFSNLNIFLHYLTLPNQA